MSRRWPIRAGGPARHLTPGLTVVDAIVDASRLLWQIVITSSFNYLEERRTHEHPHQHQDRRRHLHHRRGPHHGRLRRPPRDGHEGARLVHRVRGQGRCRRGPPQSSAESPSRSTASTPATSSGTATCAATTSSTSRTTRRSRFVSTSASPRATSCRVTGDLTIKGITKPVTIPFEYTGSATDPFGNERVGFEGSVVDQPQGLGRQLERRARGRRRAGLGEGHPGVRHLRDQVRLIHPRAEPRPST